MFGVRFRYLENIKVLLVVEYKVIVLEGNRGEFFDFEFGVVFDFILVFILKFIF